MRRLPAQQPTPRRPGDSAGGRGRAPSLTDSRAAPETPWPSSSTRSGAGSATRWGGLPRPAWSRQDMGDWLDAIIGGACLALFTIGLIFAVGVMQ